MEDWEAETAPIVLKKVLPTSNWDDEDVDENDVKDSWEDDDEPAPPPPVEPVKAPKKAVAKATEKKGKAVEAPPVEPEEPLDPVAEKLRQQRIVEEADFKHTTELFGVKDSSDDKNLDTFIAKSAKDFEDLAELIAQKIAPYKKSFHYDGLIKSINRLAMKDMSVTSAKDISSSVSAIANEKIKLEKEANAGKKKGGAKKKSLLMDKPDDDAVVTAYDGYDDYDDFM